jgi:hypothetical protein
VLLLLRQLVSFDLLLSLLASCLISRCTVYLLLEGVPARGGWKGLLSVIVRGSMLLLVLLLVLLLELLLILLLAVQLIFEEGGHLLWHYVATMLPHCGAHFISCRAVLTLSPLQGHRVEVVLLVDLPEVVVPGADEAGYEGAGGVVLHAVAVGTPMLWGTGT